ncbi:hypothetical protein TNCV_3727291 [Trichonephila clavipes]|uniref:Uncharacterized protein n=1 Tax=Trichonephila clavipes TaxID=2585209 RepID=A0A8X6R9T8_TRICX|nr:hypothetical protein TNCV_3727291 [Trichonephila clavipes]
MFLSVLSNPEIFSELESQPDNFETMVLGLIWNLKDDFLFCNFNYQKSEADNCHLTPRCLKCEDAHQTECQIKRVETHFCINCQTYGHIANYSKCLLFPKPRKGSTIKSNYSNFVNSLVRPNTSYAQITQAPFNSVAAQQIAPHIGTVPATIQPTTQAIITPIPIQQQGNNTKNECSNLITQTLQQTIQALFVLVQKISIINFSEIPPHHYH